MASGGAEQQDCAICLECVGATDATTTVCEHKFHTKCLTPWLREHDTCPTCRRSGIRATTTASLNALLAALNGFIVLYYLQSHDGGALAQARRINTLAPDMVRIIDIDVLVHDDPTIGSYAMLKRRYPWLRGSPTLVAPTQILYGTEAVRYLDGFRHGVMATTNSTRR
jgi:hypothetical protein